MFKGIHDIYLYICIYSFLYGTFTRASMTLGKKMECHIRSYVPDRYMGHGHKFSVMIGA